MIRLPDKYNQGCAYYARGDYAAAAGVFRECLTVNPGSPDLLNALGSALEALGKLDEAAGLLEKACRLRPENAVFHYNLGNLLRRKGKREQAEHEYLEAIRYDGGVAEFFHGLGSLYLEDGRLEQAEACLLKAVELAPDLVPALHDLGLLRQSQRKPDQAEELFRCCLDRDVSFLPALNSLGMLLLQGNKIEQARECFISAIRQNPDYLQARANLAVLSTWCGELEYAVRELSQLAELAPNDGDLHFNLSLALLASGRMAEGWREHEWRFIKASPVERRHADIPRWQGERLAGKRLLIHAEQGYGDSLQFLRYAGMLAEHGAIVLVEAQDRIIAPLLAMVPGVAGVFARGDVVPLVDYQIPMMTLPLPLGKDGWPPPAPPYLFAQQDNVAAWRERLSELKGLKVGLAWAGRAEHANDANRSIPEALLAPFVELTGVAFVSLQVGSGKIGNVPFPLFDTSAYLHDFCDSAALVSALDLIITVDSAVAHLAGGLGRPAVVMLPWNPDWRWQHGRSDSDWYPTIRLFRQTVKGGWSELIPHVVQYLKQTLCLDMAAAD